MLVVLTLSLRSNSRSSSMSVYRLSKRIFISASVMPSPGALFFTSASRSESSFENTASNCFLYFLRMNKNKNLVAIAHALKSKARYVVLRGGTRSGKTYSALIFLLLAGLSRAYRLCSVVSISMPHLRRGAYRDFLQILQRANVHYRENKVEKLITLPGGAQIEFFSADQEGKLRGAQRDWLFVNEVNLLSEDEFSALDVRTKSFVIVDFNPVARFWLNDFLETQSRGSYVECVSTYKDNPHLAKEQVAAIEARSGLAEWWRVYGEGEYGESTARAWYNFDAAEVVTGRWDVVGVDFGEGRAPSAVVGLRRSGEGLEAAELAYGNLSLSELASLLKSVEASLVVADPAQLDYINLLRKAGVNVYPARKMQLSASYALLNKFHLRVQGQNLVREGRSLEWADAGRGLLAAGAADHAIDALRYALHAIIR